MAKAAKKAAKKTAAKKTTSAKVSPEKTLQTIKDTVTLLADDMEKFLVEENKSAGRRSRGHAQLIKKECQNLRKEIMAVIKSRKG